MSDNMVDEDLLGAEDEFNYEEYDITNEKEEALLQDEDDYVEDLRNEDKKDSASDTEEQEDILNLDIEEDFQDEDKLLYDDEQCESDTRKDGKFLVERTLTNATNLNVTKTSVENNQTTRRSLSVPETSNNVLAKEEYKKQFPKIDRRRRGNGRGNFHTRANVFKNNTQRRRNGTVLINPRYEGIVHINENNARLAWDNVPYAQNSTNFIQPWATGNVPGSYESNQQGQMLINNLVSELATSFAQSSANLLLPQVPPQTQNFFQPPPSPYAGTMSFQPPPNSVQMQAPQQPYNSQNQVTNGQVFSPSQPNIPSQQSYPLNKTMPQFSNQIPNNGIQGKPKSFNSYTNYDYYDRPNNQQNNFLESKKNFTQSNSFGNKNMNYNRPVMRQNDYSVKNNFRNNFHAQKDFRKKNFNNVKENSWNRNLSYSGNFTNPSNNNNTGFVKSEFRNVDSREFEDKNMSYRINNKPTFGDNFRNTSQQGQMINELNKQNTVFGNTDNKQAPYIFSVIQKNRRPVENRISCKNTELPEKKARIEENTDNVNNANDEVKNLSNEYCTQSVNDKILIKEEEDEETRLYRLKIEEQKREREKVLRNKEERRMQMMLQRQKKDEERLLSSQPEKQINIQQLQKNNQQYSTQFEKTNMFDNSSGTLSVQKPNAYHFSPGFSHKPNQYSNDSNSELPTELSNLTFKVSNNLQETTPTPVKVIPKTEASSSSFMSNRVVVVKSNCNQKSGPLPKATSVKTVNIEASNDSADVGQGLSSFLNNRKVLKKDNTLLNTRLVVVNNLSATTTQNKLVALTRGIGEIQVRELLLLMVGLTLRPFSLLSINKRPNWEMGIKFSSNSSHFFSVIRFQLLS
jgi:hypothetical protein